MGNHIQRCWKPSGFTPDTQQITIFRAQNPIICVRSTCFKTVWAVELNPDLATTSLHHPD